jgi:xylene monooxygenase electron transfer component
MFGLFKKNKSFTAKLVDYEQEFVVEPGDSLLTGALKAGLSWPKKCQVGSCGTCKCKILDGKTREFLWFLSILKFL